MKRVNIFVIAIAGFTIFTSGCYSEMNTLDESNSTILNEETQETNNKTTYKTGDETIYETGNESNSNTEIVVTDSHKVDTLDLTELEKQFDDLYENGKMVLKSGEEANLTSNGLYSYGPWTVTYSFALDSPMTLISNSTFRIVSGGFTHKTTESGSSFVYDYFFQERCKYYNTSAVKIIVDDNGNRQWINENGDVVLSDNDYTEWNDLETIISESPKEIYEKELERVIPLEHEVVTDENGNVNVIYHYVHQTRQHK